MGFADAELRKGFRERGLDDAALADNAVFDTAIRPLWCRRAVAMTDSASWLATVGVRQTCRV
jgi:hypothetical protein